MKSETLTLAEATTAQLVEELARRMNRIARDEPPSHWCDECIYFRLGTRYQAERKDWNPCSKGHAMEFYVPQPHDGPETFGYFLDVCADREHAPEPTSPEPPQPPIGWEHPSFRMKAPPRGQKLRKA